jgi:hypothetical protein
MGHYEPKADATCIICAALAPALSASNLLANITVRSHQSLLSTDLLVRIALLSFLFV